MQKVCRRRRLKLVFVSTFAPFHILYQLCQHGLATGRFRQNNSWKSRPFCEIMPHPNFLGEEITASCFLCRDQTLNFSRQLFAGLSCVPPCEELLFLLLFRLGEECLEENNGSPTERWQTNKYHSFFLIYFNLQYLFSFALPQPWFCLTFHNERLFLIFRQALWTNFSCSPSKPSGNRSSGFIPPSSNIWVEVFGLNQAKSGLGYPYPGPLRLCKISGI